MKLKFTTTFLLLSAFMFAKNNNIGTNIIVQAFIDRNCNKIGDKD